VPVAVIGIGVVLALLANAIRYALIPVLGDVAPYAFVFVAVTIAAIAGGWRSSVVAMIVGQALAWYMIIPFSMSMDASGSRAFSGLVTATLSQLLLLVTIAVYQREVDKGTTEREQRLALLDEALNEIDHRTRNNYQAVLAMIDLQARRSSSASAKEALRQVSDRRPSQTRPSNLQCAVPRSARFGSTIICAASSSRSGAASPATESKSTARWMR